MEKVLRYNVVFRPEPEGGFTTIVPSLPGCITYGKNLAEARKMAVDAIKGYIVSLKKHKEPIPTDKESLFSSIDIKRIPAYAQNSSDYAEKIDENSKKHGFQVDHITGSHFVLYEPKTKKRTVIAYHTRNLPKGTLMSILNEAGISREEFLKLLKK